MKFNQEKSKIMLHTKIQNYDEDSYYKGMLVCRKNKVLGFMMDSWLNNLEHVKYLE